MLRKQRTQVTEHVFNFCHNLNVDTCNDIHWMIMIIIIMNNGNRPPTRMRKAGSEDGKLLSHLEWPNAASFWKKGTLAPCPTLIDVIVFSLTMMYSWPFLHLDPVLILFVLGKCQTINVYIVSIMLSCFPYSVNWKKKSNLHSSAKYCHVYIIYTQFNSL